MSNNDQKVPKPVTEPKPQSILPEFLRTQAANFRLLAEHENAQHKAVLQSVGHGELELLGSRLEASALAYDSAADLIEALNVPQPQSMDEHYAITLGIRVINGLGEGFRGYATPEQVEFIAKVRRENPNP